MTYSSRRWARTLVGLAATTLLASACERATEPLPSSGLRPLPAARNVFASDTPILDPANGHYYEFVRSSLDWTSARDAAAARTLAGCTSAHLATITSPEEDAFVGALDPVVEPWWIGGFEAADASPNGDWQWVTGEPFVYAHWRNSGEPNGGYGENELYFQPGQPGDVNAGSFVDFPDGLGFELSGYIVEYEGGTCTLAPPQVSALHDTTIVVGETYVASGTITDTHSASLTATVSYGGVPQPLALSANAFSLSNKFTAAGTFQVTVTATDDAGLSGSATATVTVQSPAAATQTLQSMVTTALGASNSGPFLSSLDAAVQSIAAGNATAAVGQLNAFIHKVAAQSGKKISTADAITLTALANRIITGLTG